MNRCLFESRKSIHLIKADSSVWTWFYIFGKLYISWMDVTKAISSSFRERKNEKWEGCGIFDLTWRFCCVCCVYGNSHCFTVLQARELNYLYHSSPHISHRDLCLCISLLLSVWYSSMSNHAWCPLGQLTCECSVFFSFLFFERNANAQLTASMFACLIVIDSIIGHSEIITTGLTRNSQLCVCVCVPAMFQELAAFYFTEDNLDAHFCRAQLYRFTIFEIIIFKKKCWWVLYIILGAVFILQAIGAVGFMNHRSEFPKWNRSSVDINYPCFDQRKPSIVPITSGEAWTTAKAVCHHGDICCRNSIEEWWFQFPVVTRAREFRRWWSESTDSCSWEGFAPPAWLPLGTTIGPNCTNEVPSESSSYCNCSFWQQG